MFYNGFAREFGVQLAEYQIRDSRNITLLNLLLFAKE